MSSQARLKLADQTWRKAQLSLVLLMSIRLYFRPVVLGHDKPFFAGPRPPLRLVANDLIGEDAIRLTYIPA
jgi:hypothetical protein